MKQRSVFLSFALLLIAAPLVFCDGPIYEDAKKVWVWPAPEFMTIGETTLWADEFKFTIKAARNSSGSKVLNEAISRTSDAVKNDRIVWFLS